MRSRASWMLSSAGIRVTPSCMFATSQAALLIVTFTYLCFQNVAAMRVLVTVGRSLKEEHTKSTDSSCVLSESEQRNNEMKSHRSTNSNICIFYMQSEEGGQSDSLCPHVSTVSTSERVHLIARRTPRMARTSCGTQVSLSQSTFSGGQE